MQSIINKWGNSLALRLPKPIIDEANLSEGAAVEVLVQAGVITITPARKRPTLAELLAQCDPNAPMSAEEREWLDAPAVGREVI